MKLPLILVNFKSYSESTGKNALKLSKICESVSKKYKVNISVAPSFTDIFQVSKKVKIGVFAQHIDPVDVGQFTGHVTCLAIKEAGAIGALINHSERKLTLESVRRCVELTKKYSLVSVCFAAIPEEAERIATLNPDFIAIEPPELIGTGISVSSARPEVIVHTVNLIKKANPRIKVLCGAGITKGSDIKKAIELGTVGVVVSSGVVKEKNPRKVLTEFAKVIK
jgi:triosephosphate isomerase